MQTLHRALLLKRLYLLQSLDYDYCNPQFIAPKERMFSVRNIRDLKAMVESCKLCTQRASKVSFGMCNANSKIAFITFKPLMDAYGRFSSNSGLMLKKIIENVLHLQLHEISVLSLLKCEVPQSAYANSLECCMQYFLEQLNFCNAKILVVLGSDTYAHLTQDGSHYEKVQGKLLEWSGFKIFSTYALSMLISRPNLKPLAHKEFLELKKILKDTNV